MYKLLVSFSLSLLVFQTSAHADCWGRQEFENTRNLLKECIQTGLNITINYTIPSNHTSRLSREDGVQLIVTQVIKPNDYAIASVAECSTATGDKYVLTVLSVLTPTFTYASSRVIRSAEDCLNL